MLREREAAEAALASRVERTHAAAAEFGAAGVYGEEWRRRVFKTQALESALGELREVVRSAKVESGLGMIAEVYGAPSASGVWLF